MPILTAYIGFSSVSYLIHNGEDNYNIGTFPFVYSDVLFGNYASESKYYKELFSNILKEHGYNFSDTEILLGASVAPLNVDFEVKRHYLLNEVIEGISATKFPIDVSPYSLVTPGNYMCYLEHGKVDQESSAMTQVDPEEVAYYHNLSIYQNIIPYEMNLLIDQDRNVTGKLEKDSIELGYTGEKPISFMGSRFSYPYGVDNKEIDYVLMLNLIKTPGIYDIELDRDRFLILEYMLRSYKDSVNFEHERHNHRVGTLINTYGDVECLVTSSVGTTQLLDIQKDRIFVIPLNVGESARLTIKNNTIGNIDKDVTGGSLGIIFDTRTEKYDITSNLKTFNESIKVLGQALNKI